MELKDYQSRLLEDFEAYLSRARELKNPAQAFAESTLKGFGHALPYHPLPEAAALPYVCLRVPTGGGKTRLAGQAIACVNRAWLTTDASLTLWLVPSEPIRAQTLRVLKTPGELLYEDMRSLFGAVHVLDIEEALSVQPATLNTANTIIVATMQSFKRDTADGLRVYRQNGALMAHFVDVSEAQKGDHSLMDVIRLRRPFVVVDEAHNQGTPLAVDTLLRFQPACILELTATPDRSHQPSNVLRSVSAATLQAEDMLKLPLELATHAEWRIGLREAIARLRKLEQEAEKEHKLTGEIIRPIMLIQAERKAEKKETFTPDRVKKALIKDFAVPAETIAIATGAVDELGEKRIDDPDYPQFIITVDKLREGWDCPTAYVLFSFRNTTSPTAVEQVLGRVLRMPHVKRKQQEELNRAYAFVVSDALAATVESLRDGLVQSGFERLETTDLIRSADEDLGIEDLFSSQKEITIPLPEEDEAVSLPDQDKLNALSAALRNRIDVAPESGTLTVKGEVSADQVKKIADTFQDPKVIQQVRERMDTALAAQVAPPAPTKTPAERGETAKVPLLVFRQGSLFEVFGETALRDADWEITDFDARILESEFSHDLEAMRRARLSISQLEKIEVDVYDRLEAQLALFGHETGWGVVELVNWLDGNLNCPYADRQQKVAWLNAAVTYLMNERGFELEELAYRKFRLRGALERKLAAGLKQAKQQVFDGFLKSPDAFSISDEHTVTIEQGRYGYDTRYTGLFPLKRHFYSVIGNLKSKGEEFECAEFIANQLEGVKWWVRNVERKSHAFSLQTGSDLFYPDFIVMLENGVILVVEYKGAHIADCRDTQEKERIGQLWAARSKGRCRFVMVKNKNWDLIKREAAIQT